MANTHGWGGARAGAGRKPKPVAQKISEGNPGKRQLNRMDANIGKDNETPPEYFAALQGIGDLTLPTLEELYNDTVNFLRPTKCLPLISRQLISDYALWCKNFLEAEQNMLRYSQVAKTEAMKIKVTTFVDAATKSYANVERSWRLIYEILRENCMTPINDELNENPLYRIANGRLREKTEVTGG
jgi:hypothetical protein